MAEIVNEFCKLDERLEGKSLRRGRATPRPWIPIGPLTANRDAAPRGFAQDQRLGRADTTSFEDREPLPSKRVERVTHLSPSQRLAGNLGSSL